MTQTRPRSTALHPTLLPAAWLIALLAIPTTGYAESPNPTAPLELPGLESSTDNESIDARSRKKRKKAKRRKAKRRSERRSYNVSVDLPGLQINTGRRSTRRAKQRRQRRAQRRSSPIVIVHEPNPTQVIVRPRRRRAVSAVTHSPSRVVRQRDLRPRNGGLKKSNWFHAGGGFGSVAGEPGDERSEAAGRAVVGGGGSIGLFYGGGEVSFTGSKSEPFDITAAGMLGITLPTKGFQPMLGLRTGVGQHSSEDELSPHFVIGPQLGFLLRKPGQRQGLRVMADLGFDHDIAEKRISPEFFLTFSAVF